MEEGRRGKLIPFSLAVVASLGLRLSFRKKIENVYIIVLVSFSLNWRLYSHSLLLCCFFSSSNFSLFRFVHMARFRPLVLGARH